MKVGGKYYIISHAYFHYLGEVTEILGPKMVALKHVVQIHSSKKSWTKFFTDGLGPDDSFDVMADMPMCSVINAFEWAHPILDAPTAKALNKKK